jgi:tetratricopeptide (TPR) repeat protein
MPSDEQSAADAVEPFGSLAKLRAEHVNMMRSVRRDSLDEAQANRIRSFVRRIKATGALIDSPAARETAQGILDYWSASLFIAADRAALSATPPALDPYDPANAPDLSKAESPYHGLSPFSEGDAGSFFGREEAVKTVLDKLRDHPVVLVVGPMGSGKTSLVFADVVPRLKSRSMVEDKGPAVIVACPETDPLAALLKGVYNAASGSGLRNLSAWVAEQENKLRRSPGSFGNLVETVFPDRQTILIVDRLEDLFTLCADPTAREQFLRAVISTTTDALSSNRLILIVREDYRQQALRLKPLQPLAENSEAWFSPPPLNAAEVHRVIEGPAASVGLKFDDGIVDDLVKEVVGDVVALPTLQFVLTKLWNERERNRITWDAYRKIGRPREALRRAGDGVFNELSSDEKLTAERVFLELVQPAIRTEEFLRRRLRRETLLRLDAPERVARVLDAYVESGLIRQVRAADPDDDRFEVAHDALVTNWPRLREWLQKDREVSEKKQQLVATARLWQQSGFKSGYLLSEDALDEAAAYTAAAPELKELVAESKEHARRQTKLKGRIGAAVTVIMAILAAIAVWGWRTAGTESERAKVNAETAQKNAKRAEENAQKAFEIVKSILDVIHAQTNKGELRVKPAEEMLNAAERIFESIKPRLELAPYRADLLLAFSDVYMELGDYKKALAYAEQGASLAKQLVEEDAGNDSWQHLLYASTFRIGDLVENADRERALREYNSALKIAKDLAAKDPGSSTRQRNVAFIENKIGDIYRSKGAAQQSLEWYRSALATGDRLLTQESEKSPDSQKTVADARTRIAEVLAKQERFDEALTEYKLGLEIRESLARNDPNNDIYQSNLSTSYFRIGNLYKEINNPDEAVKQYNESLKISESLARKDPDKVDWQIRIANVYVAIADILAKQNADLAAEKYRSALTIRKELSRKEPGNVRWAGNIADVHSKLAKLFVGERRFDAALKEYDDALEVRMQLARRFPDDRDRQKELAAAYMHIGDASEEQGRFRNARESYQKGLTVIEEFMLKSPSTGLEKERESLQQKIQGLPPNSW